MYTCIKLSLRRFKHALSSIKFLKRLLNHKMNNDVTAGYIMRDVERLRKPMQQISNFLLKHLQ